TAPSTSYRRIRLPLQWRATTRRRRPQACTGATSSAASSTNTNSLQLHDPLSASVSVLGPCLGWLSGWCRCSLFVSHLCTDPACGCLGGDLSERRGRCPPGARWLA